MFTRWWNLKEKAAVIRYSFKTTKPRSAFTIAWRTTFVPTALLRRKASRLTHHNHTNQLSNRYGKVSYSTELFFNCDQLTASHKKKPNNDQNPSCYTASLGRSWRTSRSLPRLGPSGKVCILASDVRVGRLHGKRWVECEDVNCRVSRSTTRTWHHTWPHTIIYTIVQTAIVIANINFSRKCR